MSLTSFPQRIKYVKYTIFSLLSQTYTPQKIILWLANEQFPNNKIPNSLLKLQRLSKGRFEILWCDDLKSYKKLIPSLQSFKNTPIITADDDVYYNSRWLEYLWESYQKNKNCIHTHMATVIQNSPYSTWREIYPIQKEDFKILGIGVGGILYPPNCFHKDILDIHNFQKLAPLGDDLYFWAMAVLSGTKIKLIDKALGHPKHTLNFWNSPNLYEKNCYENLNDVQFQRILEHYPQIKQLIYGE